MDNKSNELIHEIGGLIIKDEQLFSRDWDSLTVVFETLNGEDTDMFGMVYHKKQIDDFRPKSEHRTIVKKLIELRQTSQLEEKAPWIKALIQLRAKDNSIEMQFEYEDEKKWTFGASNYEEVLEELRPK